MLEVGFVEGTCDTFFDSLGDFVNYFWNVEDFLLPDFDFLSF
jgi:hypothetical protein